MNPVSNLLSWTWDKLRGNPYRYSYAIPGYYEVMSWEVTTLVYANWQVLKQDVALDIVQRDKIKPHFRYRHFTKRKKDGSLRHLVEPDERLKQIQHIILKRTLNKKSPHPAAVGFQKGKSIADHLWPHAGARVIITSDIQDFFPSTKAWRIEEWWRTQFESPQAAHFYTLFTSYQGSLPQGAPTSPALSNLVNFEMDRQLSQLVLRYGGRYTRYCDDMVFSWHGNDRPPADIENTVRTIIHNYGYDLHPRKGWRVYTDRDEPEITGAVLNRRGTVSIPKHMEQLMRELRKSADPADLERLNGYEGYRQMVEDAH